MTDYLCPPTHCGRLSTDGEDVADVLMQTYAVREAVGCWECRRRPWLTQALNQRGHGAHSLYCSRAWAGLFVLHPFHVVINIVFNVQLQ